MVETLVSAGARVLGARGWAGLTTNEVAEVAGVSIGSLYQYFPNKGTLVGAIRRQHLDAVLAALRASCRHDQPPTQLVTDLVDGLIAAHSIEPGMHRALLDELPRGGVADFDQTQFEAQYLASYKAWIAGHRGSTPEAVSDVDAQVLSAAVAGVIHDAARRGTLQSPWLKQELVHLITAYLTTAATAP